MTDYTELKRLAEAANAVTGDVSVDITISSEAGPNQAEIDAVTAFIGAATPAAVLSLIAENERLSESDQEATELCDTLSVLLGEIAVAVRGPEEPKSRHGFHDLPSRVKTVVAERDQLKAENEALRQVMSAVVAEIPGAHISRSGNAPGHCHSIPGVWDGDNGAKAGKECAWCKVWNYAAAMGKGERGGQSTSKTSENADPEGSKGGGQ